MKMMAKLIQTPLGFYVYDANMNDVLKVNQDLFIYISNLQSGNEDDNWDALPKTIQAYEDLKSAGYLAPSRVERIEYPGIEGVKLLLDRSLELLTLQVTQNCNLRCKYCIYSESSNMNQRSHSANVMTFETAKRAVDFYRDHSVDHKRAVIGFYGGEPLLAFPLIKQVVSYVEDTFEGKEIAFDVTTNATLLTEEIMDFLLEHKFLINFSIDGPQPVQDRNRVFPNGSGSYDIVMRNINRLYEKDPAHLQHAGISMVIDSTQSYSELLTLLKEPCLKNVNLLHSFVESDGQIMPPSPDYIMEYNNDLTIALLEGLRSNSPMVENKILTAGMQGIKYDAKEFESHLLPSVGIPSGPCIPGKVRLFVNCFGEFYACERVYEDETMKIGSLDEGFNLSQIRKLLNIGQLTSEECKNCWAFSMCNICSKRVDDGHGLSTELKRRACQDSKSSALYKIREKILVFEESQRMKEVKKRKGVNVR